MGRRIYTPVQSVKNLQVGQSIITPGRTIFESSIVSFCGIVGDNNPLHLDALYSAKAPVGRTIAPAPMILSLAISLWGETRWLQAILLPFVGLTEWRLEAPVYPGDTIWAKVTVSGLKPTSKGQRHLLDLHFEVMAHRGQIDQPVEPGQNSEVASEEVRAMYFTARFLVGDHEIEVM